MSDFLILNFDCPTSPYLSLEEGTQQKTDGWGFGWYYDEGLASSTIRGTGSMGPKALAEMLHKDVDFRATVFTFKLRGINRSYTYDDTQPISRSYGGRDWLFLHNGEIDKHKLVAMDDERAVFLKPVGRSDSEAAFCHLLGLVSQAKASSISDIRGKTWLSWFKELDSLGWGNYVITDGSAILVYRSQNSEQNVYLSAFKPPHPSLTWNSKQIDINLSDVTDSNRTMLMVTTEKTSPGDFQSMEKGQLIIAKRGAVFWNSHNGNQDTIRFDPRWMPQNKVDRLIQGKPINLRSMTQDADGTALAYREYIIKHNTSYHYERAVEHSVHHFRILPVEDQIQNVVHASLTISVEGLMFQYEDVFGNSSLHYDIQSSYKNLEISAESRVRLFASPQDDYSSPLRRASIPLVWMPWQRQMMLPYLLPPELPETQLRELTEFAMSFVERNDYNLMHTLVDINRTIFEDFKYTPGATTILSTPFDVYTSREGVCQDFTNLFICMCRLLSIPSRYRMGYIYTGKDYKNKAQSDASHAWIEVYLPYLGWRGFDPTNGTLVSQDHIRVACGRNYRDATPTAGTIHKGGGRETLKVSVKVLEA